MFKFKCDIRPGETIKLTQTDHPNNNRIFKSWTVMGLYPHHVMMSDGIIKECFTFNELYQQGVVKRK